MIDRRLQMLRAVGEYGTVTAAAHRLHVTPSTLSQRLRQLSRELGVTLLEPHGRRVRLTPAAHTLIGHADALYARWEQAIADLHAGFREPAGVLRLCGFPTAIAGLLAPAAARMRAACPNVTVHVAETETHSSFALLLSGDADISVVVPTPETPPLGDARFDQQPLLTEPLDLLVPTGHPLAGREFVDLAEAAYDPWIVAEAGTSDHNQLVLVACAAAGFAPDVVHQAKEWVAVSALVAQGLGVSLIPRLARLAPPDPVVRIPLRGETVPSRRILTCVRRGSRSHPTIRGGLDALHAAADAHPAHKLT